MRRIRLVIADRRPIVLRGFASLLAAERDFEVVASCVNGTSCLEAIRNLTPDVVLVEDGFSDVTASEMLAVANAENLSTRLVFYTASVARGDVADAIADGACNAISMRAKPETVLKSLRLVAPQPDRPPASKAENGGVGEDVLATLTDEERKIMRLVAYGLSNKEIARQLNVSPGAIKTHLDHLFQKLRIGNRPKLATLALSRLSGGVGLLAALIFAALDDVQAADHTLADTFTMTAADGTAEVATITVTPRKSVGTSAAAAGAAIKAGRVDNPGKGRPTPTGQLVDFSVDFTGSTVAPSALNSGRPSLGSSSAFMMVAAGVLLYELDLMCRPAQAFEFGSSLTEVSTSTAASGSMELVTPDIPGSANANHDGFRDPAWLSPGIFDRSFAFDIPRSEAIAIHGDELQIAAADADSAGTHGGPVHAGSANDPVNRSDTIDERSATANALAGHSVDHGGFGETTGAATSQYFAYDTAISSKDEYSNRGQSQRDLHADEDATAKQHAKHDPPGHDSNHGQSQRDLNAPEDGSAPAKQHAKNDPPGHDSNHGQSQRDLHASEDDSSIAEQHAGKHATPESNDNPGQSQRNLHAQPVNDSRNSHAESSLNAGGKDPAPDDVGQKKASAAPDFGDSFHFKNETANHETSNASNVHVDHRPASTEHGLAEHDGRTMQDADLMGLLVAEQHTVDHATGSEHHLAHFLII